MNKNCSYDCQHLKSSETGGFSGGEKEKAEQTEELDKKTLGQSGAFNIQLCDSVIL